MDVLVVPETQDGHNSCVFLSSVCYMSVALFQFQQFMNLLIWLFIELYRHTLSRMSWWSHFEVSTAWVWKILIILLLVHIHWTPNFSSITRQHSIQKVLMFACLTKSRWLVKEKVRVMEVLLWRTLLLALSCLVCNSIGELNAEQGGIKFCMPSAIRRLFGFLGFYLSCFWEWATGGIKFLPFCFRRFLPISSVSLG